MLREWPEDYTPKKLVIFIDTWVHTLQYTSDHLLGAVFRCNLKVTAWRIEWKEGLDGNVLILPKLKYKEKVHLTVGLIVLEMQGLDNCNAFLVILEKVPKFDKSKKYRLILDYEKLSLDMCETVTN